MISICEKFGVKYSVKYNENKSICISFDRAKDRNSYFNDNVKSMYLFNSYCCHLYGSQAWCFADKSVENITTAWNKAVRKIWKLPYDSHTVML